MVTRACISINNRCNLKCVYCHFHEKSEFVNECEMDVVKILDNIIQHIDKNNIEVYTDAFNAFTQHYQFVYNAKDKRIFTAIC